MSIKRKDLTEVVSNALGRRSDKASREAQTATATKFEQCTQKVAVYLRRILGTRTRNELVKGSLKNSHGKRWSSRQAAMSAEADRRILEAARARPQYILAAVQLQRAFGLRAGEVVESGPSLPDWERTLGQFAPIRVHGDRGGARYTHPVNWGIALQAVRFALHVMEKAGRNDLFPQITPNLALRCYQIAWKRHLTPASGEGCMWSYSKGKPGEPDLFSFAAITDEPPPEVAAAGHDRCIIPIKREHLDAWLNPDPSNLAALYAILDDRDRPYYKHRLAA